jgi:hypothetical protein
MFFTKIKNQFYWSKQFTRSLLVKMSRTLLKHLDILQTIFTNALTDESPIAQQPAHITTNLRIHQLAILAAMRTKEQQLHEGYSVQVPGGREVIHSNFAVLGDRVGVGKTLMTLGHISQMTNELNQLPLTLNEKSTSHFYSTFYPDANDNMFSNLIIVPHTLFRQWQDTIRTQTTLKAFFCKTQRDLDKSDFLENLQNTQLTLISNTLLQSFMHHITFRLGGEEPCWQRVFFDEADSLKISSYCPPPKACMRWYISATFSNILFSGDVAHSYAVRELTQEFIQTFHPEIQTLLHSYIESHPTVLYFRMQSHNYFAKHVLTQHSLRGHLVVLCDSKFLETSVQLPPLHRRTIFCQAPAHHQFLTNMVSNDVATMLHAGDTDGALQALGVSSHTPLTLVEAVTGYKQRELDRLKRLLEFKKEEEYASPQAKQQALQSLEERIKRSEEQIDHIKERLAEVSKDSCSICYESNQSPLITPCCTKMFCANCILEWMTRVPACPLCRTSFHPSQLTSLSTSNVVRQNNPLQKPKKIEALIRLFQDNPDGRFLVFSRYENPFHDIENIIDGKYRFAYVQGNKDVIANTLDKFERGQLKILFLNSRNAAAGMNISSATHLVLLHKMGSEEEKQILGRAYRLGRTTPLEYISLLNEQE